jgi:hypothetical protein
MGGNPSIVKFQMGEFGNKFPARLAKIFHRENRIKNIRDVQAHQFN